MKTEPSIYEQLSDSAYAKYERDWDRKLNESRDKVLNERERKKAKKLLKYNKKFDKSHKRVKKL